MKFIVDPKVFETFEDLCFGVVVAKGIDNQNAVEAIHHHLNEGIQQLRTTLGDTPPKEHRSIALYREAFEKMGTNPNKFMCSIEALAKRVAKGNDLPKINNVVDLSNAISLKYLIPLGAHDLDQAENDLEVRFSKASDTFLPFGETEVEKMAPGELVYASGDKIKTRRWIWRQSDEGKIVGESSNIFFPLDGFKNGNLEDVLSARDELAELIKKYFNCDVVVGFVDKASNSMGL